MSEIEDTETKTEDKFKIPRYVWYWGLFFLFIALCFALFDALEVYQKEWVGLSSISLALAAIPVLRWRMDLLDKQNKASTEQIKIANKNIEIQQQGIEARQQEEYRKNYLDSIKNIESEFATLRLSAIHELREQLETDEKRHPLIINILSSALRKNTIQGDENTEEERKDKIDIIQATLDALACRKPEWLPSHFRLNLNNITFNKNTEEEGSLKIQNLKGANLRGANFENIDIDDANLEGAILRGANFTKTIIWQANFTRADLWRANFEEAGLQETNFTKANLSLVDFKQAFCEETNFEEANLCAADLSQATGITQEQIDLAFGNVETKLPSDLWMPSHWPKIKFEIWQLNTEWNRWKADPEGYIPPKLPKK